MSSQTNPSPIAPDLNPEEAHRDIRYPHPFAELALYLASGARRNLRIYSPMLDHEVFDNPDFASAITALVRNSRNSNIRLLINDSKAIVKRGHRLLDISRRLSSSVKIQLISEHPELITDNFVIRDNDGIVYKPNDKKRLGFYEPHSKAACQQPIEQFDLLWERSQPDRELRELRL